MRCGETENQKIKKINYLFRVQKFPYAENLKVYLNIGALCVNVAELIEKLKN